jgi:hypothetical protein
VPLDLGGTRMSQLHINAYTRLRRQLGMPPGAVRPLISDLIDTGIDILNQVQFSAGGMDLPN